MNAKLAIKAYHWPLLAQPFPLPEMLLETASRRWLDHTLAAWTKSKDLSAFHPEALAAYRSAFRQAARIHAMCNNYRAGATCDLADDEADMAEGRKIAAPMLALWGDAGFPSDIASPLAVWEGWCGRVEGRGIDAGHFLVVENPTPRSTRSCRSSNGIGTSPTAERQPPIQRGAMRMAPSRRITSPLSIGLRTIASTS